MLTAVGGSPPCTWDLAPNSAMFAGLELSLDGFISGEMNEVHTELLKWDEFINAFIYALSSGTPTESGIKTLEVVAVDADGTSVSKFLGLTIAEWGVHVMVDIGDAGVTSMS